MKPLFTILAAIMLPVIASAQQNYREGYVVNNNGDTVKGYINVKEWETNPQSVSFKKNHTYREEAKYTPLTIKGFSASDYSYLAYVGHVSNNKNVFPDLDSYRDTTTRIDTVFLHELISGSKVSLYDKFKDNKRSFFYKEGDQAPVELIYYNYYEDGSTIRTLPVYISQIFELQRKYLGGNVKFTDFDHLGYKRDDLLRVIQKINGGGAVVKKSAGGYDFFVGLGGIVSGNQFGGDNQFVKAGTVNSFSPKISAGVDVYTNSITRRLVLRGEVSFAYNKPTFAGQDPLYTGLAERQYYAFEQYNVTITPQVLYNFYSTSKLRLFASVGLGLNLSFYKNNRFFAEGSTPGYLYGPYKLEQYWANFPLQVGTLINNRFEIAAGYTGHAAFTSYTMFSISSSILGGTFRYHFK
ncbi:hypothetical protein LJ707_11130 [Mucilaginibacter sp. UR6-1]|uniref:hypothetical protein n=1 Tax=Mucilaginibacter sp. UR6-1 TaxID=1435643 RepID=UPI001E2FD05C|nr:hypothetical protein [Mucilaginibacter sp. UR6-1]MCC8409485.1 hypothetical protein [Mucilaginibacter sp. UR6-1]